MVRREAWDHTAYICEALCRAMGGTPPEELNPIRAAEAERVRRICNVLAGPVPDEVTPDEAERRYAEARKRKEWVQRLCQVTRPR
jgi:proteasome lid subunit RPN8/RPN11